MVLKVFLLSITIFHSGFNNLLLAQGKELTKSSCAGSQRIRNWESTLTMNFLESDSERFKDIRRNMNSVTAECLPVLINLLEFGDDPKRVVILSTAILNMDEKAVTAVPTLLARRYIHSHSKFTGRTLTEINQNLIINFWAIASIDKIILNIGELAVPDLLSEISYIHEDRSRSELSELVVKIGTPSLPYLHKAMAKGNTEFANIVKRIKESIISKVDNANE